MEISWVFLVSHICFKFVVIGKYVLKTPLVISPCYPIIKILRYSSEKNLAVDSAGSPGYFASGYIDSGVFSTTRGILPIVFAGPYFITCFVTEFDFLWKSTDIGIVVSSFQKQNRMIRVFCETGGNNRTCRTCSNYYCVIFHLIHLNQTWTYTKLRLGIYLRN